MNQFQHSDLEREVLSEEAVAFLIDLENEFGWHRGKLLENRITRRRRIAEGEVPGFLVETSTVREDDWTIAQVHPHLIDRRVEITGPVDRKMMINALNSGANVFMADFEDANTPTWDNVLQGQANLVEAYDGTLSLHTGEKRYSLREQVATLVVRPRGWHLNEKHFLVDDRPMSASLFDFGLYLFHGGRAALANGTAPFLYLPKLESHLEARLWNDVFVWAQDRLGMPRGTIKATVLIETVLAAFEMEEILYELRDHAAGLNAGRWDYIFSLIKTFHHDPAFVLPDRGQVTMSVPFMRAYTELMVKTCHRRGAHAIGGMSAFIPNRRDRKVTDRAVAAVSADKARESAAGFDGTWVAHPDLVEVARAEFDHVLGDRPNQLGRLPEKDLVTAQDLLDVAFEGSVTIAGVRTNISVGIRYLAAWLEGTGAVAIDNLMEDVATAEISRSQIWQWVHHRVETNDGTLVSEPLVRRLASEVASELESEGGAANAQSARKLFEEVALSDDFVDFLTLPAYQELS